MKAEFKVHRAKGRKEKRRKKEDTHTPGRTGPESRRRGEAYPGPPRKTF